MSSFSGLGDERFLLCRQVSLEGGRKEMELLPPSKGVGLLSTRAEPSEGRKGVRDDYG